MKNFNGIFTALLTPFDPNGKINKESLKKLVKFNIEKGVTGFYVGGSTAEAFLMSTDERMQIMEIVKNAAPDSTLIAHIGCLCEDEAIKLGIRAKELSYDLVSSVAPFYYHFTFDEIKNYYCHLADASLLPMLIYHFPDFSGVKMGMGEMSKFLSDGRFFGIKYTSNDFFTMEKCKAAFPDKYVYNGYDEMLLAGLSMGADGAIGSTYNFMADKFVRIYELFHQNKIAEAKKLQAEANRIITVLCDIGVIQAEKEVLNQLGIDLGVCRNPFKAPDESEKERIRTEIIPYI